MVISLPRNFLGEIMTKGAYRIMKLILLDNFTKQALHVLRVISGKLGWSVDVYCSARPLCSYSKYISEYYQSPKPLERDLYYSEFCKLITKNKYDDVGFRNK